MSILYLLIPLSLILLGLAVWAFFWAVKNDQFDDLEGPAYRILFDDDANDIPLEQRRQDAPEGDGRPRETHGGHGDTRPADSPPEGVKH